MFCLILFSDHKASVYSDLVPDENKHLAVSDGESVEL
jgi:hypothetical protein